MTKVLGFDEDQTVRAVEVDNDDKEQVQQMLESKGWTNLVFLEV